MSHQIKLFLKKLSTLILPIILVLLTIEFTLRQIPNSYKLKSYQLNTIAENIKVIALGNSHTLYAINPKYMTFNTFNAANISQSPDVDLAILNTYKTQLKNLRTIVIRLSYDTLFEELKNSSEDWRLKDYKLYTDIKLDYNLKHNSELLSMGTKQCLKTLKTHYIDGIPLSSCDSLGWGNDIKTKPLVSLQESGMVAAKRHTASSWHLLDKNIYRFEKIMLWGKLNGVDVYLITFPAYESYRNNLNEKQLYEMIKVGEFLANKYPNCTYYNFINSKDFNAEDFYDSDHLNERGAKKISLLVNSLIEN